MSSAPADTARSSRILQLGQLDRRPFDSTGSRCSAPPRIRSGTGRTSSHDRALWGEPDEAKRIAGYKAVDKHIAEEGEVIPLLQYVQPIVFADTVEVTQHVSGAVQPI